MAPPIFQICSPIRPASPSVRSRLHYPPGQTQQFSAQVAISSNQAVNWSINPAGAGTISSTGLYTAPTNVVAQQGVKVIATSQASPAKYGSAMVTLLPGTGDGLTQEMNLIVKALCRDPHAAPVVSTGPDQLAYITGYYYGVNPPPNSAIATLVGSVLSYTLNPGNSLTYGWSVISGPGAVFRAHFNHDSCDFHRTWHLHASIRE